MVTFKFEAIGTLRGERSAACRINSVARDIVRAGQDRRGDHGVTLHNHQPNRADDADACQLVTA